MAEEEVIVAAPATSPVSSDCKRKFEDLHSQPTESNTDGVETDAAAVAEDDVNKRPRLDDDNQNDLANTNGHQEKEVAEAETETEENVPFENAPLENAPSEEVQDVSKDNSEETAEPTDANEIPVEDVKEIPVEDSGKENDKEPSKATEQDASSGDKQPISGSDTTTRKIEVPSNKGNNLVDRISDLPDELLLYILSFLPAKLTFTMAFLSKRWTPLCYPPSKIFCFECPFRNHQKIYKFNVTKWLEAAIQCHMEELHLTLPSHTLTPDLFVSKTLVVLKLERVYVGKDTSCVHLPSLKTLSLISVSFENRNDYINFLHACPILEDLHAEPIYFIQLNEKTASKLEVLKPLTLVTVLSVGIMDGLFNNVKFPLVDMECTKEVSLRAIPLFPNLISIKLVFPSYSYICWDGVVERLLHCPRLQILFIKKWRFTSLSEEWKYPISVLEWDSSNLRSCTIFNFDGSENDLRFAKYILQKSGFLQDMTIGNTTNEMMVLPKGEIIEQLSSYPRKSPGCTLSFLA